MKLSLSAIRVFSGLIAALSVTSTAFPQVVVWNVADSGVGSLRQALTDANNVAMCPKPCRVMFNIPGQPPNGYWTILPISPLPVITEEEVVVDGFTQTAFGGDTNPRGPEIVISGRQASFSGGLSVEASAVTIRGLGVQDFFGDGITIGRPGQFWGGGPRRWVRVLDNYIGIDADGQNAAGNRFGVYINFADDCIVANNVISGNQQGIMLWVANRTRVLSNTIGPDASQWNVLGNGKTGIGLLGSQRNTIEGNIIAGHSDVAVGMVNMTFITSSYTMIIWSWSNAVRQNVMYANGIGIDLDWNGPTPNDVADLDGGPNALQNYPVLSTQHGFLIGQLDSTPNTSFEIEIYTADSNVINEGRRYLLTVPLVTSAAGLASFYLPIPPGAGPYITATATDLWTSNTSEFCEPILGERREP